MKKQAKFLMILVFAASCTEIIEINVGDNAPPQLVIYGYITNEAKQHSIRITRSVGFSYSSSPESGATVSITDCDGNIFELAENPEAPGIYQTAEDVSGKEGKTYKLDVLIDGRHYTASAQMPHMHDIEMVEFRVPDLRFPEFNENFIGLYANIVDADNLPEDNYYSVFVTLNNDTTLNSTIDRFSVLSNISGDMPFYFFRITERSDGGWGGDDDDDEDIILRPGDIVTVNINAISREYATFISTAQTELSGSIPIFSGPPANVRTNIKGDIPVLGFFTAFSGREAEVEYEVEE